MGAGAGLVLMIAKATEFTVAHKVGVSKSEKQAI
jgi:hypothetical protein